MCQLTSIDHQGLVENIAEDGIQLLYAVVFLVKLTVIASYSMLKKLVPFCPLWVSATF